MIRKYKHGDPGNGSSEIINSRPIPRPAAQAIFDVTPHGDVVTFDTTFDSYIWDEVLDDDMNVVTPAMYYHEIGIELTFTASLRSEEIPRNIIEYYWDFGDGTNAIGQEVTKTYYIANPGIIAHLRVTEDNGQKSFASMNLMLLPTEAPTTEWLAYPDRWDELGDT